MKIPSRGFTLIELLVVVGIIAVVAALLLPALSAAKKRALQKSMSPMATTAASQTEIEPVANAKAAPQRTTANIKSFVASVSLRPGLSVGTAQPESIYTASFTAKIQALSPARSGECEVHLPLPPQMISLADLVILLNGQPTESVELRNDKLVWFGELPGETASLDVSYSAVGKGLYNLQIPPSGILDNFRIDLTAVGSDVRMLELSLQPTRFSRANGQTVYTWEYKRLLMGRPIALDVLGVAPIDRLGELAWLGPASVVIFGLILGLVAHAFNITNFDRWMLLLVLGTFAGAYPLMYFAQEFISLNAAIFLASIVVLLVIALRTATIMGRRLALFSTVLPAAAILVLTLVAAIHTKLQGLLITVTGMAVFVLAMILMPRLKALNPKSVVAPAAA